MRKLTQDQTDKILDAFAKTLDAENIVIVYGDHVAGKIDTMMRNHASVSPINFGENAIDAIRTLLHRINHQEAEGKSKSE